jgi:nucleoid-associated protein EbfC
MKQAQKIQQDINKTKAEIDKKIFPGKYSYVEVEMNGKKELLKVKIDRDLELTFEDIEMLEDMIVVAVNDAIKKIDIEIAEKIGKFGAGLQGLI